MVTFVLVVVPQYFRTELEDMIGEMAKVGVRLDEVSPMEFLRCNWGHGEVWELFIWGHWERIGVAPLGVLFNVPLCRLVIHLLVEAARPAFSAAGGLDGWNLKGVCVAAGWGLEGAICHFWVEGFRH